MYLKKIIAQGFKSFADNTIIDLENNIAGIVGPNGSGKSNVVDAVRWVLGEQSVKSLRGEGSMTDVIFAGSKSRNPMNVATVTLVLDNSDNYLNIAYDEISIKRRLYKDGTNEFFINGEKCRLKDISDLLMDSGIAKESFNIISQGKIEDILSSKPENRRIIFEEAAGVLKYKKRKEEALKKLDKTHDNMNRINDIINELESQIEPLREQKIKAQEYQSLNETLKELEISLVASDITNINYKYQEDKNKIEELNQEIIKLNTSSSSNDAKISSYKLNLNELEKEIKNKQNELLDITTKVEKLNAKKQIILERKKYQVDNTKLHDNLINLKEEELSIKNSIKKYNNDINIKEEELKDITKDIDDIDSFIIKEKSKKNDLLFNLNNIIKNINVLSIKIDTLKSSIENNSSLPYSVKSILDNPKLRGIHNTIASLIETNEKYSKAISISLGGNATCVVVDNEICAKDAINYLKTNNIGRVTFFPLNVIKDKSIDDNTLTLLKKENGFIDIASSLVKCEKKYDSIIKNQLGNVIVVDDLNSANIISKKINYRYRVVTLDGEILHVGGSLTGGNIKTRNIITDKYELENNIKDLKNLEDSQKNIENNINEVDYNLKALEDKLYLLNKDKINNENSIISIKNLINDKNTRLEALINEINGANNSLNNTVDKEEEEVLKEYYEAIELKNTTESKLEMLNNNKIKLDNELE